MDIKHVAQGIAMGLMDGLITILGIIIGVGTATNDSRVVIISGLVGGVSNSFGTSIGFYTSENAERGQQIAFYKKSKARKEDKYIHSPSDIVWSTALTFIAGVMAHMLPVLPFLLSESVEVGMIASFLICTLMLFLLGYYIGKTSETNGWRSGVRYVALGIASAVIAFVLGEVLKHAVMEGKLEI